MLKHDIGRVQAGQRS